MSSIKRPRLMCAAQSVPECLASIGAVVITGASSGIGEEFVRTIASISPKTKIFNLSRTSPAILSEVPQLRHCAADLSTAAGQETALQETEAWLDGEGGAGPVLLINNSGFGTYGPFPEPSEARTLEMVDLNMRAPVLFTARLLPRLRARGGAVVNIASTAAFQPMPLFAIYAASKAFLFNWSMGLWRELIDTNVHVLCVCPGPTSTNFFRGSGFKQPPLPNHPGQTSPQVVEASLRALAARKPFVVSGWSNKLSSAFASRLPRVWVTHIVYRIMRKLRLEPLARQKEL